MKNIYLVGMMGSGKSVTGRKLAEMLGYSFWDLDIYIQEKTSRSINDLFQIEGESFFRSEEKKALAEVASKGRQVVATGGGTVLDLSNVEKMKETGTLVFLETSLEVLWERVRNKKDRPLLRGEDPLGNLKSIFNSRAEIYQRCADLTVNTDGLSAEAAAQKVLDKIRGSQACQA